MSLPCRQLQMEQQLRAEMQAQLMNQVKHNEQLSNQVTELAARYVNTQQLTFHHRTSAAFHSC